MQIILHVYKLLVCNLTNTFLELMSESYQYLGFGTNNIWAAEAIRVNIWQDPFRSDSQHERLSMAVYFFDKDNMSTDVIGCKILNQNSELFV